LRSAAAVVANTPLAKAILVEWLGPACVDRVTVIPNGFDPTDLRGTESPRPRRSPTEITIVHAGTLHAPELRRSRFRRFRPLASDNAARSVVPIAKAIESLRRESPETASRIRVRLLGHVPAESREWIASIGLADCIRSEGAATHAVALEAVRSADALLVVQVAWQDASRPVPYVPGKVYEYLATGLPILAPIARGDLWDLLRGVPQAYLCDYRDVRAIADNIQRMVADIDTGRVRPVGADFLAQYDRRRLTEQLASVFDGALRGR
jgi:glycosyltransferase involved in cell wall biosynthesis